tara:strand:+ start:31992 stop:32921 length:930 start_codon:yes stop_codon:yes gene_type:complete
MSKKLLLLASTIIILSLTACEQAKEPQTQQSNNIQTTALPANHPAISQIVTSASLGDLQGGTIKEVFVGGGYTYVKVERNGVELWAAGPQTQLNKGQLIGWYQGTLMRNFNSKSLSRTFDEIYFISKYIDPLTANTRPQANVAKTSSQSSSNTGGIIKEVLVSGGYTYTKIDFNSTEIWAAGPMEDVKVGEYVSWSNGQKMTNFTSTTLNRTFNEIYFISHFNKGNAASQPKKQNQTTGIVTEVITSAGYSYIQVATNNSKQWLAAPESKVKQQDNISWINGSIMHNFQSRSLERSFEEIIFVDAITIN